MTREPELNPTLQNIIQASEYLDNLKRQQFMEKNKCTMDQIKEEELQQFKVKCTHPDCQYADLDMWLCLNCHEVYGGNGQCGHALAHHTEKKHPLAMNLYDYSIWCFKCYKLLNLNSPIIGDLKEIFLHHKKLTQWQSNEPAKQEKIQQNVIQQKIQYVQVKSNNQQIELCSQSINENWDVKKYDISNTGKISFDKATCYAVAIIYMLAHVDCFSNYFITFWSENQKNEKYQNYQFTSTISKYIQHVRSPPANTQLLTSNELSYAIDQLMLNNFQAGKQQDANEFLQILFEHLTKRCKFHANICFMLPPGAQQNNSGQQHAIYIQSPQETELKAQQIFQNANYIPNSILFIISQQGEQQQQELPERIKIIPKYFKNHQLAPYESTFTKQQLINYYYLSQMAKSLSINVIQALYAKNNIKQDDEYWPFMVQFLQLIFISIEKQQKQYVVQLFQSFMEKRNHQITEDNFIDNLAYRLSNEVRKIKVGLRTRTKVNFQFVTQFIELWKQNSPTQYYNFDNFNVKLYQSYEFKFKSAVYYTGNGQSGHYISRVGNNYINGNSKYTTCPSGYQPYIFAMERQNDSKLYTQMLDSLKNQNLQQMYGNMINDHNIIIKKMNLQPLINTQLYYKCPSILLYYLCQLKQIPQCRFDGDFLITEDELTKYSLQPFQECGFIKINGITTLYLQSFCQNFLILQQYKQPINNEKQLMLLDSLLQNMYSTPQQLQNMPYILSIKFINDMKKQLIMKYQIQIKPANYDLFQDKTYDMQNIRQDITELQDYISITQEQQYQIELYYNIYPIEKAVAFQNNENNNTIEGSIIESSQDD